MVVMLNFGILTISDKGWRGQRQDECQEDLLSVDKLGLHRYGVTAHAKGVMTMHLIVALDARLPVSHSGPRSRGPRPNGRTLFMVSCMSQHQWDNTAPFGLEVDQGMG